MKNVFFSSYLLLTTTLATAASAPVDAPAEAKVTAAATEVPLTDLAKRSEIDDIALSPDGKTLAVLAPKGDYSKALVFIDTATMKAQAGFSDNGERVPGSITWVSNERVILDIVQKFGGFAIPSSTGELLAVNRDGTDVAQVFGATGAMQAGTHLKTRASDSGIARIADPLVQDDKFALITINAFTTDGSYTELHRMNERSGAHKKILTAPLREGSFLIDHTQTVRFSMGTDVNDFAKLYRRDGSDWTLVFDEEKSGAELSPLIFARDNKTFYAFLSVKNSPSKLVRVDAATLKTSDVYVPKTASPLGVLRTADRQDIYAVTTADGAFGIEIIDDAAPESKALRAFAKNFPGSFVRPVDYSSDGQTALFEVSASDNNGEYYVYDLKKSTAKFLFPASSWLDPAQMAKTTPFELKARDGVRLHGYLTMPTSAPSGKNLPLVVMPHGGPYGVRDFDSFDAWAQVFATRGYAVLKLNFRGSGGYGGEFVRAGYGQWGRAMQDDLTDATKWAITQGVADPKRIAIAGASYGGYAALMGAAREPDLYQAVISYVGVSDLELMYSRGDIEDSSYGKNYLKRVIGEDKAQLKARSPVNLAANFKAPVLIVHGGQDPRVPVLHGRSMRDALKSAGKPVEYLEVADEMHGFYKQKNVLAGFERMLAFLDKHLALKK
jgi:dipeptidyl aminopeptidase/acylaminoacyl peptidase